MWAVAKHLFADTRTSLPRNADQLPPGMDGKPCRKGAVYGYHRLKVFRPCLSATSGCLPKPIAKTPICNAMRCSLPASIVDTSLKIGLQARAPIDPGLTQALAFVRPGDVLVVWKLDRLGRSLTHLIDIVNTLKANQVAFRSLTEGMDTTTASGELFFHIFGALAQFERALIKERVTAGLAAARHRGRIGGRPPAIPPEKLDAIVESLRGGMSKAAACRTFGVKRTTLIETLRRIGAPELTATSRA